MSFGFKPMLTAVFIAGTAASGAAQPGPADFGARIVLGTPSCGAANLVPMHVSAVAGAPRACCTGQARCSNYLATTRTSRVHDLLHT